MEDRDKTFLELDNVTDSVEEIRKLIKELSDLFTTLGMKYPRHLKFHKRNMSYYVQLRNSIQFRLRSVYFHYSLLQQIQEVRITEIQNVNFLEELKLRGILNRCHEQSYFIFDSIIFTIISAFDYYGNIVDFLFGRKNQAKLKWNGIKNLSHEKTENILDTRLSTKIIEHNREFVDKLYDYRSRLIHIKNDTGNSAHIGDLLKNSSTIRVYTPESFVKKFKYLKNLNSTNKISINFSVFWTIEKTVTILSELVGIVLVIFSEEQNQQNPT